MVDPILPTIHPGSICTVEWVPNESMEENNVIVYIDRNAG